MKRTNRRIHPRRNSKSLIQLIVIGNKLPQAVVARLDRVAKAMSLSTSNEELVYVAWEYALTTFEMAMRQRYEEIMKESPKPKSLYSLVRWASGKGLLEESEWRTDLLRILRNSSFHSPMDYKLGAGITELILKIVDTINDLYVDPTLRAERRKSLAEINTLLQELISDGAVLEVNGTSCPIFKAGTLYQRKRSGKQVYYLLCWPTFDMTPDQTGNVDEGKPLVFATERILGSNSEITCDTLDSEPVNVTIRKVVDPDESVRIKEWIETLNDGDSALVAGIDFEWSRTINSLKSRREEI